MYNHVFFKAVDVSAPGNKNILSGGRGMVGRLKAGLKMMIYGDELDGGVE